MAIAVTVEDVKANGIKHHLKGGWVVRTDFMGAKEIDGPQAFTVQYEPARLSTAHFHETDQFQIIVDGSGKLGRHTVGRYAVHFSRAFTPYGPLASDDVPEGMTFLTLRRHGDPGAQKFPESKARLREVADRQPWQMTHTVSFDAAAATGVQPVAALTNDQGLRTYAITLAPQTEQRAPAPAGGDGQFIVILEGSLLHDNREYRGLAVVSVDPNENAFQLRAGAKGLKGVVLNFPVPGAKPAMAATAAAAAGFKRWHCVLCAFEYDEALGLPDEGIAAGTRWADVPESWSCPDCSATKADFEMVETQS